jgi:CubicO group peptidase (beta-lactamase class C family)
LISIPVLSQNFIETKTLDHFMVSEMAKNNVKGAAVVIVSENELVFMKGYGVRNSEDEKVQPTTRFDIGSLTKSFTAMAILQLMDNDLIGLEDYVTDHLPDFTTNNSNYSNKIQVKHLLNHTSGFSTLQGNSMESADHNGPRALQIAVKNLKHVTLQQSVGEQAEYSNANYIILGAIIEQITGSTYEKYIRTHIFEKLHMTASDFGFSGEVAKPYRYFFGIPVEYEFKGTRDEISAAGITSSVKDIGSYLSAILRKDTMLLSSQEYERLFNLISSGTNQVGTYGWMAAFVKKNDKEMKFLYHDGLAPGFHSVMILFPAQRYAIMVTTNTSGGQYGVKSSENLVYGVLENVLGIPKVKRNSTLRLLFTVAWILPLFFLLKIIMVFKNWKKQRKRKVIAFLTIIALLFCYFCLKYLPNSLEGVNFKTAYIYAPETGLLLLLICLTLIVWSLLEWIRTIKTNANTLND